MKKYFFNAVLLLTAMIFSGCSLAGGGATTGTMGGVMRSADYGSSWEMKNKVDEKRSISSVDVLSIATDPLEMNKIYLGTKKNGILISKDNAESWESLSFPAVNNVYGLAINHFDPSIIFASCSLEGRGKIFKTQDSGENWEEIYTEPSKGTYITAMSLNKNNPGEIFVGTNKGVILKSVDGGISWNNLYSSDGAVAKIIFSEDSEGRVYFLIYQKGIFVSDRNGEEFKKLSIINKSVGAPEIYSIEVDKNIEGVIYVGTNKGLFKSFDFGETFEELDTIASSREFPVRAVAVNPFNPSEIIYSVAQAMYRSVDGGEEWSTFQLGSVKNVSQIEFNKNNPGVVFAGLRNF